MAKQKILICDDSEGVRESLKLILEDDYDLAFACDGNEAVDCIKKNPPQLAILDIKMPKLNGIDALKKIQESNPGIKVLFVTGYQYAEAAKGALKLGAYDYIVKPFNPQEIKSAVKKILKNGK